MTRFEFIVDGPPVSQQAPKRGKGNRLEDWKKTVLQEAEKYWSSEQKTATELVMLQITYFYDSVDTPHRIGGWGFLSNPETDSQRRYQCTPTDSTQV